LQPANGFWEADQAALGTIHLVWLDPNGLGPGVAQWENAVLGNSMLGSLAVPHYMNDFDGVGGFAAGSWDNFALQLGVTSANLSNFRGSWGVDIENNHVWAVLDHNSQFAVIPEPSSYLLALIGVAVLTRCAIRRRRRNTIAT
jgi:hypothetical protein